MNGLLNNRKFRGIIELVFIVSFICISCKENRSIHSSIYINSETGKDNNQGTIKRPLQTISEVNKHILKRPFDIYFAGGQTFKGTLTLNKITGTDSLPYFVGSYGEGKAAIYGGDNEAIMIENCRCVSIENLTLKGSGRKNGNITNGLQLKKSDHCVVKNVSSEGFQKSGVDLYDCRYARIFNVYSHDNGFCGINVMGSIRRTSGNILIKDCKAENNPGDPTMLDNHSGNGILVGVSNSVTIDHCSATNNGWDMPRLGNGPVGIWTWESDHITIQYCISFRNKTSKGGKDGGGFDLDGGVTNSLIQYCLSYENQGAGYGLFQYPGASDWSGNIVRYCISINDARTTEGSGSFFIWNGSGESKKMANCYIYNNVVYNSSAPVISFEDASDHMNFRFSNNIFLCTGKMITGVNKGSSFIGNVWWNPEGIINLMNYHTLPDWAEATGQETIGGKIVGLQTDPKLTGPYITSISDPYKLDELKGYILKPDSPLLNRGIKIKSTFGLDPPVSDFYGNPVYQDEGVEQGIFSMN